MSEIKPLDTEIPLTPGYYWAKWKIASPETHEGHLLTPSEQWEIVQVNINHVNWEDNPREDDEALSVLIPGVRETQWRDQFYWGEKVANSDTTLRRPQP